MSYRCRMREAPLRYAERLCRAPISVLTSQGLPAAGHSG